MSPILDSIGSVKSYGFTQLSSLGGWVYNYTLTNQYFTSTYGSYIDTVNNKAYLVGNNWDNSYTPNKYVGHILKISTIDGSADFAKKFVNSDGSIRWDSIITEVKTDSSQNVYFSGSQNKTQYAYNTYPFYGKLNSSGTLQWQKGWQNDAEYKSFTFEGLDIDSNYLYLTGQSNYVTNAYGPMYVRASLSDGSHNSLKAIAYSVGTMWGYGIARDSNSYIYICGGGSSASGESSPGLFAAWSNDGSSVPIAKKTIGTQTTSWFEPVDIEVSTSGNIYLCGRARVSGIGTAGIDNITVAKFNSSGSLQWIKCLYQSLDSSSYSIALDSSENVYVSGLRKLSDREYGLLVKYDSSGALQWQRQITTPAASKYFYTQNIKIENNFMYIAGYMQESSTSRGVLLKLPANGASNVSFSINNNLCSYEPSNLTSADLTSYYSVSTNNSLSQYNFSASNNTNNPPMSSSSVVSSNKQEI